MPNYLVTNHGTYVVGDLQPDETEKKILRILRAAGITAECQVDNVMLFVRRLRDALNGR